MLASKKEGESAIRPPEGKQEVFFFLSFLRVCEVVMQLVVHKERDSRM